MTDKPPHEANLVDVHVGGRLRELRLAKGLSQQALAVDLGLSFQQVQKYERGRNRVSASMLYKAAARLDVPIDAFFDGLDRKTADDGERARQEEILREVVENPRLLAAARDLRQLPVGVRDKVIAMVRSVGAALELEEDAST